MSLMETLREVRDEKKSKFPSLSSFAPINQPVDLAGTLKQVRQERTQSTPQTTEENVYKNFVKGVSEIGDVSSRTIQSSILEIPKAFTTMVRIATEPRQPNQEIAKLTEKHFPNIKQTETKRPDNFLGIDVSGLNRMEDKFKKVVSEPLNKQSLDIIDILDKKQQEIIKPIFDEKPGLSNWKEYLHTIESGAISLVEAVGITLITKNSNVGAGFLSSLEASDIYNKARSEGVDHQKSLKTAAESGIGTFVLEKIGLDYLFALGGASKLASALKSSIFETAQEELQTVWQNLIRKKNIDKTQKIFEGWFETAIGISIPSFFAGLVIPGLSFNTRRQIVGEMAKEAGVSEQEAETAWGEMIGITRKSLEQFREQAKFAPGLTIKEVGGEPEDLSETLKKVRAEKLEGGESKLAAYFDSVLDVPLAKEAQKMSMSDFKKQNGFYFEGDASQNYYRGTAEDFWNDVNKAKISKLPAQEFGEAQEVAEEEPTKLSAEEDFQRAESEVLTELELSQKGERIFLDTGEVRGVKSTFPKYVPENLRSKELFDKVIENINQNKKPRGTRQAKLMDIVSQEILNRIDISLADEKATNDFLAQIDQRIEKEQNQFLKELEKNIARGIREKRFTVKQVVKMSETSKKKGFKLGRAEARVEILSKLKETQEDIKQVKQQIVDYAKEKLSLNERGKFLTLVKNAQTQKDLIKAFIKIDKATEVAQKKANLKEVKKIFDRIINSQSVDVDFKARVKELIPYIGSKDKLKEAKGFLKFAEGKDLEIPERLAKVLEKTSRKSFEEMTLAETTVLVDELETLEHLGRTKVKARKAIYEAEKEKRAERLSVATPLETHEKIKAIPGERLSASQKFKNLIYEAMNRGNRIDKVLLPIDVLADMFDGGKGTYDGDNYKLLKGIHDSNFSDFLDLNDELVKGVNNEAQNFTPEQFEKMGFVAALMQESGKEKIQNLGYTGEEAVELTTEEQKLLAKMKKNMHNQLPYVRQIMKELFNQEVNEVDEYFSFMTDFDAMEKTEFNLDEGFARPTKTVEIGFTKARKGAGKQKIKLNALDIYNKHMQNVAYLRTTAKDIKMTFEIVNTDEFKKTHGDLGQLLMLEWLDVMARKGGVGGSKQIALLDWMRKNLSAAVIGFKLSSIAIQPTAFIDGMGMVSPSYAIKGMSDVTTSKEWREFLMQFPELRDRTGGETAIAELIEGSKWQKFQAKGFIPLQFMDKITASAIVAGAYQQKMDELGLEIDLAAEPNQEAMDYAQMVMRRTQSSALFKDVPLAISRGALSGNRSLDRAFLQFQNFLLTRWSRIRYDAIGVSVNTKDPKKAVGVLFFIMMSIMAASGIRMGVRQIIDFITGDDNEEENQFLRSMLFEALGSVPFLGNIFGAFVYDNQLIPIIEAPKDIIAGAKKIYTGKKTETKLKGANEFITSLSAFFGVPGSLQMQQLGRKLLDKEKIKAGDIDKFDLNLDLNLDLKL